jgi:hypothetical protein
MPLKKYGNKLTSGYKTVSMKASLFFAALLFSATRLPAQKQSDVPPRDKERTDSAWGIFPKLYQHPVPAPNENNDVFKAPGAKTNNFEMNNPGASLLYITPRGTVYRMPLDNMAVLVPDMNIVERMPRSRQLNSVDRMPNLYRAHPRVHKEK